MLSVERVKELLNDPTLSDAEVEQVRDEFQILAEIIFEKWKEDQKKALEQKKKKR
jgi:hypothetical protein